MPDHSYLLRTLIPVARTAGAAIMEVYRHDVDFSSKVDGSPVTLADKQAEAIILAGLKQHASEIPIISEENAASHKLTPPERFFLVDPLDGTAEFIKRDGKGSFTVNIALVEHGSPTLGIVYAPALDRLFEGSMQAGARENGVSISTREVPQDGPLAVASTSHRDPQTNEWLQDHAISKTVSIGSSLKFCLIACGEADVYPRFGPTMEWDTAAGHAVLSAAGGSVSNPDGSPFIYGKPDYRNSPFIARG